MIEVVCRAVCTQVCAAHKAGIIGSPGTSWYREETFSPAILRMRGPERECGPTVNGGGGDGLM